MRARFLVEMECGPTAPDEHPGIVEEGGKRFWTVGAEVEHPQCFKLVHGGFCEAVDDECRDRVALMDQTTVGKLREINERIKAEQKEFQAEMEAEEWEDEE